MWCTNILYPDAHTRCGASCRTDTEKGHALVTASVVRQAAPDIRACAMTPSHTLDAVVVYSMFVICPPIQKLLRDLACTQSPRCQLLYSVSLESCGYRFSLHDDSIPRTECHERASSVTHDLPQASSTSAEWTDSKWHLDDSTPHFHYFGRHRSINSRIRVIPNRTNVVLTLWI